MSVLLFDTNVLLWAVEGSPLLSQKASSLLDDTGRQRWFSALAVAEVAIKTGRGKPNFDVDPWLFRSRLLDGGFVELPLTGIHAGRLNDFEPIHKDPFDRLMLAQALAEGVPFVTADALLANYPGQVIVV